VGSRTIIAVDAMDNGAFVMMIAETRQRAANAIDPFFYQTSA